VTTSAAGNLAGHSDKDKEKNEKRRALGRGLASLLPGPRVLNPFAKSAATTAEAPLSRDDDAALKGRSSTVEPAAQAPSGENSHFSQNRREVGHPVVQSPDASIATQSTAELRSAGQPMAAVPTSAVAISEERDDPFGENAGTEMIEIQAVADSRTPSNLVVNMAIADIDKNPFQTRYVEDDEALEELADSIKATGVVQPIVVRPAEEKGRYTLVLGERRLHASKKADKTHIPALVRRLSEQQAAEMTIVENLQREDLSSLEQAQAFKILSTQFDLTQEEIAQRVGLSRASIANYMRLLKLPREVMEMLAEKRINFAQAKELLKLGDNDRIAEAALYAVKKGMNIEQIEMLVLRMDGLLDPLPDMPGVKKPEKKSSGARWVDPNVRAAQMDLERMLGVRVRIRDRKGKGKIVIEYHTVDDYERVVEMLRGRK